MSVKARRKLILIVLLLGSALLGSTLSGSSAARPTLGPLPGPLGLMCTMGPHFDLRATDGFISVPDGNSIYMWSFAPDSGEFQLPGPVLCVTEGDDVSVDLTNDLGEPVSIIFPGQIGVTASMVTGTGNDGLFTLEANPGDTVSYSFHASEPGTYLYESGTLPQKQVQMGLYGALLVYPSSLGQAYDDPATAYEPDREYLILLNEIDPELHYNVEHGLPYDATAFRPDYWTINGRSFPDTLADNDVPWLPSQPYGALVRITAAASKPALIRYANAGMANHPFHPHGNQMLVIARDGRLLDDAYENFTRTIGSGQTYDLLFQWTDVDAWITGGGPVPVTIPGLQNLVFKDGATFYSGDPHLGEQGEFPVDVTSFNQCGEYYFPWHSHALFEFTNFNEGFGGLATLLRVEPPGGCP